MEDLTIAQLEELCKKAFEKREEIDSLEKILSGVTAEFEQLKETLLNHLLEFDKTSYDSSFGKITARDIFTVPTPKDPEKKKEFFEYLKAKGQFDDMISVNSKTLNAYYKQEMEAAKEEGRIDFRIPGLDEPYHKQTIAFKKK